MSRTMTIAEMAESYESYPGDCDAYMEYMRDPHAFIVGRFAPLDDPAYQGLRHDLDYAADIFILAVGNGWVVVPDDQQEEFARVAFAFKLDQATR